MPAPRAAEMRLSSISRFSKLCAAPGAAMTADRSTRRRKFGTITVTPMIWRTRSNCRAKRASSARDGDSLARGLGGFGDLDRDVAVAHAAFLQRPADRRRPRRAQFDPVEPAAGFGGAGADDADRMPGEPAPLRLQRRPGLRLQHRLARLKQI